MKIVFNGEIILLFEKDICENDLISVLNINGYTFSQKSKNRVNPITKEKNDGYWRYKFSEIETYDSKDIQNAILNVLNGHHNEFEQVAEKFNSKLIVRIYANITDENPALMFENEFLKVICDLNGTLDIVIT